MRILFLVFAMSVSACSEASPAAPSCEERVAERDRDFVPIKAEMNALREEERKLGGARHGYPPLQLAQRYLELEQKVEEFEGWHPMTGCETEAKTGGPAIDISEEDLNAAN